MPQLRGGVEGPKTGLHPLHLQEVMGKQVIRDMARKRLLSRELVKAPESALEE
jgi:hypothetical protein